MIWLTSLLLLAAAAALLWWNRPGPDWAGAAAARFAAALIAALYALLAPWPQAALSDSQLLLQQLSLYAALPLLLSVILAQSFGYDWSRLIWGRILLGWCVVFELCRRNDALTTLTLVLLGAGALILLLAWWQQRTARPLHWLHAIAFSGWLLLSAAVMLLPEKPEILTVLSMAFPLICINLRARPGLGS